MNRQWLRWSWLLLIVPVLIGFARLRFDVEVLNLLPDGVSAVAGVKLYQQHFSNARELIITVESPTKDLAAQAAQAIAGRLRAASNLVAEVTWQPPWLEHPEQTTELIAHLWLNQPPQMFSQLAARLAETNLAAVLRDTREELATTLSPAEIARLSYDPFGLTRLPENVTGAAPGFGPGDEMFASPEGTFRILFVKARGELAGYRECAGWLAAVEQIATSAPAAEAPARLGFTGRPAFVAEISASMKKDIVFSVIGTSFIIALLFWLAHRRWQPMLWLLTLLGAILVGTLALGGLFFGTINVISMGFAAILLGLAVDYAVVHYQEALAHPDLSVPEIRRAIAPSIFWAAVTTITAFLVLNFGGLPGLAQLGSLVGVGVVLSAFVMIFAFLPPLFPDRMKPRTTRQPDVPEPRATEPLHPLCSKLVLGGTAALILGCGVTLLTGVPGIDASADALQPRHSRANTALNAIKEHLGQKREPLWLVFAGRNESEIARRLDAVLPVLDQAVSNGVLAGFTIPSVLWPRPEFQTANRATALELVGQREEMRSAALAGGFSEDALGLADGLLDTWQRAAASTNVFWPTNDLCRWIFDKLTAREVTNFFAVGFLFPPTNSVAAAALTRLAAQLPRDGVWLAGWELLGGSVLGVVKQNMWKLVLPMVGLVLLSLWLAFRRGAEILLSLAVLLGSGVGLLAAMKLLGWSWNPLNLMAVPLILGTGVDYSLFMQLALRRHHGNLRVAHRSVGRALLLCGGTAIAGFGALGLSSNAGMASLGQVCAVGIAGNMLISVFLLPVWWRKLAGDNSDAPAPPSNPSSLYSARLWSAGLMLARLLPRAVTETLARISAALYWRLAKHRRELIVANILPVVGGDRTAAEKSARDLWQQFALKLSDLWRFESGEAIDRWQTEWSGREFLVAAQARGRGVLLVTPHLGNWEFGGALLARRGEKLLVLTQAEPGRGLTELRQKSRARWGIETLVVGEDAFAFVEIIKRLQAGATVALLVDRPPPPTAVTVELFGRPFQASVAAAELARASGCAILPTFVIRTPRGYRAEILPEIAYDRAAIGDRAARTRLTQEILRAFEPVIRQHVAQWYHFVPIWP